MQKSSYRGIGCCTVERMVASDTRRTRVQIQRLAIVIEHVIILIKLYMEKTKIIKRPGFKSSDWQLLLNRYIDIYCKLYTEKTKIMTKMTKFT